MNKKNKVLLTSVGLAMLSGIAATGSTFAWFTTTRTASISYSKATVASAQSNLKIAFAGSKNTFTSNSVANENQLTLVGGNKVTDISGDGINFYKPVWSATPGIASKIVKLDYSAATGADNYFVDFTVTLTVDGQTPMNVYVGEGSGITPVGAANSKDLAAVASTRMAVLNGSTPLFYYAPNANGELHLTAAATEPVDVSALVSGDAGVATTALTTLSTFTTLTANPVSPGPGPDHAFIGNFAPTVVEDVVTPDTKDITFRVWIEGQDGDADNDAIEGVFNIDIKFYALEA